MDLKPGEFICDQCNGTGHYVEYYYGQSDTWCDKCYGAGKLDWIENVVG
jgi:DnaJ-class molecular chaperone